MQNKPFAQTISSPLEPWQEEVGNKLLRAGAPIRPKTAALLRAAKTGAASAAAAANDDDKKAAASATASTTAAKAAAAKAALLLREAAERAAACGGDGDAAAAAVVEAVLAKHRPEYADDGSLRCMACRKELARVDGDTVLPLGDGLIRHECAAPVVFARAHLIGAGLATTATMAAGGGRRAKCRFCHTSKDMGLKHYCNSVFLRTYVLDVTQLTGPVGTTSTGEDEPVRVTFLFREGSRGLGVLFALHAPSPMLLRNPEDLTNPCAFLDNMGLFSLQNLDKFASSESVKKKREPPGSISVATGRTPLFGYAGHFVPKTDVQYLDASADSGGFQRYTFWDKSVLLPKNCSYAVAANCAHGTYADVEIIERRRPFAWRYEDPEQCRLEARFVTLKPIPMGKELCWDYGGWALPGDKLAGVKCRCPLGHDHPLVRIVDDNAAARNELEEKAAELEGVRERLKAAKRKRDIEQRRVDDLQEQADRLNQQVLALAKKI